MAQANDHTRTTKDTKERIIVGAMLTGQSQADFVSAAVDAHLKNLGIRRTVDNLVKTRRNHA